jgi:hypothetical protein
LSQTLDTQENGSGHRRSRVRGRKVRKNWTWEKHVKKKSRSMKRISTRNESRGGEDGGED